MAASTEKKYVSIAEVKNILGKVSKERKEMIYEQKIAYEHAQKFAKLSVKKTNDLVKDLQTVEPVSEFHAYKIADLLPESEEEIKSIFAKERININENDIKKILEIVQKHYIK